MECFLFLLSLFGLVIDGALAWGGGGGGRTCARTITIDGIEIDLFGGSTEFLRKKN